MNEVRWVILLPVGIAGWTIDRAIRQAEGRITRRLDQLEACLGRIDLHTAPDPKDFKSLGTLLEEALLKAKGE
jgi:hypothetical protein